MKPDDFIGEPCSCEACTVAGVSEQPIRRDPRSGEWMHGRKLADWYRAKATFDEALQKMRLKVVR